MEKQLGKERQRERDVMKCPDAFVAHSEKEIIGKETSARERQTKSK